MILQGIVDLLVDVESPAKLLQHAPFGLGLDSNVLFDTLADPPFTFLKDDGLHVHLRPLLLYVGPIFRERPELPPHIEECAEKRVTVFGVEVNGRNRTFENVVVADALYQDVALIALLPPVTAGRTGDPLLVEFKFWY